MTSWWSLIWTHRLSQQMILYCSRQMYQRTRAIVPSTLGSSRKHFSLELICSSVRLYHLSLGDFSCNIFSQVSFFHLYHVLILSRAVVRPSRVGRRIVLFFRLYKLLFLHELEQYLHCQLPSHGSIDRLYTPYRKSRICSSS